MCHVKRKSKISILHSSHIFNQSFCNSKPKKNIWDTTRCAKIGWRKKRQMGSVKIANFCSTYFCFFFADLLYARKIRKINTSKFNATYSMVTTSLSWEHVLTAAMETIYVKRQTNCQGSHVNINTVQYQHSIHLNKLRCVRFCSCSFDRLLNILWCL